LADKIGLITGAATGIGAAISIALERSGADVVISDKPANSTADTAAAARNFGRRVLQLRRSPRLTAMRMERTAEKGFENTVGC
jgi:NAD(P)-dependent dehydrogenase (short-subunit alcohol dehydrogenase family)